MTLVIAFPERRRSAAAAEAAAAVEAVTADPRPPAARGLPPAAERTCRVCGCTDHRACVTDGEPCFWVDDDLCSACVGRQFADSPLRTATAERAAAVAWLMLQAEAAEDLLTRGLALHFAAALAAGRHTVFP